MDAKSSNRWQTYENLKSLLSAEDNNQNFNIIKVSTSAGKGYEGKSDCGGNKYPPDSYHQVHNSSAVNGEKFLDRILFFLTCSAPHYSPWIFYKHNSRSLNI